VKHQEGASTIQVLLVGQEPIELDLTQPGSNVFQIKTADYNFDGFKDFAFVSVDATTGSQTYDIFLYNSAERSFEALEAPTGVCDGLHNVRLSIADKTLKSTCKSGTKSSQDIYKWTSQFALELEKSIDNSTEAQSEKAADKADLKKEMQEEKVDKKEQRQSEEVDKKDQRQSEKEDKGDED
ncbi:MAG: hypothetical protein ABI378_12835, partial [Chitinophagaceae bacterium]